MDEEEVEKSFMNIDDDEELPEDLDGEVGSFKFDEEPEEDPEDRYH
jgi:hypothetical protein